MELITPQPPEKPASIGKYEVLRHLASGGMAEVFLARTTGMLGFQKPVVIKRILPHLANRADFIQMFLDEARITTQLQHPNIVQTYEVGVANHSYFIAMEYLNGENVRSIMSELAAQNTRFPIEHAVHIVSEVAAGLHYAHERVDPEGKPLSIVHRDVTPQNIIVTFDGTVKLLDFGIAKAQDRIGETRAGTLKGKLPYMSPEQCRGEPMDKRSDIFSLGIMLYELTLTRRLFRGVSDFQILKQIVEGEVTPPREIDPSYPAALEEIVLHALRKPADERYQTARELLVDLEAFRRTERLPTSPIALADFVNTLFRGKAAETASLLSSPPGSQALSGDATGLSVEIEISAGGSLRTPARSNTESLDGPDIPTTPPFHLEFTNTGAGPAPDDAPAAPSFSTESVASLPAPQRARTWRVMSGLALVGIGIGGVLLLERALPHGPPVAPTPIAAPTPVAPPAPVAPVEPQPAPVVTPPVVADVPHASEHHRPAAHAHVHPTKGTVTTSAAAAHPAAKLEGEGTLVLATTPWCDVTIDKTEKGTTPLTVKLSAGPHTIALANSEFHVRRTISVVIQPDQTLRKKLDFDTP